MQKKSANFGKWALVTGANSGIGAAFTRQLASQGYNIVLTGRREEALKTAAAELRQAYQVETREVAVDLGQDGFLTTLESATSDLDLGVLVSNAGDAAMGALLKVELKQLTQMLRLNTQTHLELVHHFGRRFAARGKRGDIAGVLDGWPARHAICWQLCRGKGVYIESWDGVEL